MIRHKRLIAALALGAACGLAGVVGVLPAVGQASPPSSPVIMGGTAHIVARGAAAKPFALVACQPGDFVQLTISLTERSGKGLASGTGSVDSFNCTGQIETITVPVSATGRPFVKGTGFGQATLFDCGINFCGNTTAFRSVKLKPAHK
jgi:hypothetical protein